MGVVEPRYSPNYRIIAIHGANRIEVQDEKGQKSVRRAGHVKRIEPVDKVCQQLPPEEVYKQFGRASKLLLHPTDVPYIMLMEKENTVNREGKQQSRREDNITLCELTKDLDPHEKIEKLINTVFSTNIEHMVKKVTDADSESSEELINQHRNDRPTEHKVQWTDSNKHTYPSDYSEESLNRLGDVISGTVFPYEGEEGYLQ